MQNLKIRVSDASESKEVQELFLKLGYKDRKNWTQRNPIHESIQAWEDGEFTFSLNHNQVPVGFKEITLPELRAMVNPMKEYLDANRNYEFALSTEKDDGFIEIPKGAVRARFYPHDPDELEFENSNHQWWHDENNEWISYESYSNTLEYSRVVWQREQGEPFLTPETTLNDQYAEIEQVRQAGLKFDNNKPRHSLLPKGSISSIIAVLEFGAKKYEANNWQKVDNAKERYYDAAMRHIDSWWNGEKFDQETGIHHLAHAATNLFFLKWFDDKGE